MSLHPQPPVLPVSFVLTVLSPQPSVLALLPLPPLLSAQPSVLPQCSVLRAPSASVHPLHPLLSPLPVLSALCSASVSACAYVSAYLSARVLARAWQGVARVTGRAQRAQGAPREHRTPQDAS